MTEKRTGGFGRAVRLTGSDMERVFMDGRKHVRREMIGWVLRRRTTRSPRGEAEPPVGGARLGISMSRRLGGAVRRGRIKRLLREAFRFNRSRIRPGTELVVYPRPGCKWKGLSCAEEALLDLCRKADILLTG